MRHGVVAGKVAGVEAQRHVALFDIGIDVGAHPVLRAGRRGRLAHRLVSGVHVEIAQALHPRIDDHRDGRIALHGEGFAAVKLPFRQPAPLLVHADHRTHHFQLAFGIDQRHQLVQVAVGVPEREDRIAVALGGADFGALHRGVFTVDVAQHVGMDQRMIEPRIEDLLLRVGAALDADAAQIVVPRAARRGTDVVERTLLLLGFEVQARILDRHERNAHADFELLALRRIVAEPHAHIVAREFTAVVRIEFVIAGILVPLGFDAVFGGLFLPESRGGGAFRDAHHEIDRAHRLRVVAERAEQFHALDLGVAHTAHPSPRFVGKALAQIEQDMALARREGVAFGRAARRGRHFGKNAVFGEPVRIVARRSGFTGVLTAVIAVIDIERARGRHHQQRSQFGASHTAQRDVREARKELVVELIGRGPPAGVLVVDVLVGTHHVEGNHGHHAVGTHRAGVGRAEVGRTDKWIDPVGRFLRTQRCAENGCGERSS